MNTDRRRILGPAAAAVPLRSTTTDPRQCGTPDGSHIKFFLKSGLLKNAAGLAYVGTDDTIVEISVYGPRPIRGLYIERASLSVECRFLPYITQPKEVVFNGSSSTQGRTGLTSIEHRLLAFIETALLAAVPLEKYPKSSIDVFINVLSFNASTRSLLHLAAWSATGASVAMVDAGIEMRDLVTAGYVLVVGGETLLDPTVCDDAGMHCVACFTAMNNNEAVSVWIDGAAKGLETLAAQLEGCRRMSSLVRSNVNGYLLGAAGQPS